jgi:proteic killer suppression protein
MKIFFASKKLAKQMSEPKEMRKAFGDLAKPLERRLVALGEAFNLAAAFGAAGRLEPLAGDRQGQFSVRVSANYRLILEPAEDLLPLTEEGVVDLARVETVRILEVVDYH